MVTRVLITGAACRECYRVSAEGDALDLGQNGTLDLELGPGQRW